MSNKLTPVPVLATSPEDLSNLLCASIELEETKKELKTLKAMCKMTDFDLNVLIESIIAIRAAWKEAIEMSVAVEETLGKGNERVKFYEERADALQVMLVQLETARQMVQHRETSYAN